VTRLAREAAFVARRLRCLVVDDHPGVVQAIVAILTPALRVEVAGDGATAIAAIGRDPPDVLLLDLKLPDMSGLRVLEAVRPLHLALPVVILTGHSSEPAAIAAANLAVSGYLLKPFSVADLKRAVSLALVMRLGRVLRPSPERAALEAATAHAEVALLHADPTRPGSFARLARALGVSRARLRALVPREGGRAARPDRIVRRLAQAQVLLRETRDPLKAIAARLGFHDAAHFSRQFRQRLGQTPRAYRRRP
jgi:YesN/AraC family two-component response regulator